MKKIFLYAAALFTIGFTACNKDNTSTNTTRVNLKITDGPGAYDALYLSVKEIQVFTAGGQSTLAVGDKPFNILNFNLGKDTLLAGVDVPSGRLQEVRLVLNPTGNRVVIGGISYDLNTPSGQTSGVKIKVQEELTAGIAYTLLLDFDAAASVNQTGNGKYQLKPVIRAISQAVSGAIAGTVSPVLSSPKVYAIAGTDTVGTVTDVNGKFYFMGLAAGTYKINFIPVSPYFVKSVENVIVVNGSVKDLGVVTILK